LEKVWKKFERKKFGKSLKEKSLEKVWKEKMRREGRFELTKGGLHPSPST